ncbi:hypothetical protein RvY_18844 [Ramazzottius varieornatus]|uniref:Uncharacterized protein n=1 Tax=Ramazzottius varieornatus TaxID=947166 RepID=A0A1D1W7B5_RAMVA|nr:hypothetical protein RvY_18844 [Ramazzottius varieornatus]
MQTFGKTSTYPYAGKEGNYNHVPLSQSYSSEQYDRQALSRKMENILLDEHKARRGCPTHQWSRNNGSSQHQQLHNSSTQSEDFEERIPSSLEEEGATSPTGNHLHHHTHHRQAQKKSSLLPSRVGISNSYTQTQEDVRISGPAGQPPSAAKDCAEAGRRIWQTLFEATEPAYESPPPAKLSIDLSLTKLNNQNSHKEGEVSSSSPNPYQSAWQRREECPTNVLKRHASRHDSDNLVDGKFIRMKFGKKVKLVQIPPRIVEPENDEVQVLVRHGKSVLWRKYKTFEHD